FMLLVSAVTWKVVDRNVVELAVIGDGSGFCCVIRKNNNCVLIGCLSEYDERTFISNYLLSRGIDNPDVIIMPTALDNVAGGFRSVVDFYKCDTVVAPLNRLTDDIKKSSVDFEMCELENALMTFYNDITVRSVPNEYGCALVVKHGNKTCLISSCSGNYEDYCEKIGGVDLIITPPVITTGVAINSTTKMVFAGDSERSGEIINKLNLENNKVVLTDGNRVIARFKGTSDIKIIRE
ncbi:MAG: hypothetical protein Q4B04_06900, partial [bacterium]|nr:hypothetical protein [bacterium]